MMTKEQREQAEEWADIMEKLDPRSINAALLRAGIAASEECERLNAECAHWNELQRDTQDERDSAWLAAWDAEWRAQEATAGWQRCARALRDMNEKLMEEA